MAKVAVKKYSMAQEQAMRDAAPLNQPICAQLAERFNSETGTTSYSGRSVTAKAVRMGLDYERKQPVSKTGAPIEKKDGLVAEISAMVGSNLETLEKAGKADLQTLRDFLAA